MRFDLNAGFEREVLRAGFVKDRLEELAVDGAELYREGVPVDEGDLRDSIFGDVALTAEGYKGRIGASDWKAALVEFGAGPTAPDGSLRRAVEALGLELEEGEQ